MKAFVTGGSGFVGRHLVRKLVARGYEVVGLARSDQSAAILTAAGAQVARGDILDVPSLRAGITGCDIVFHVAGWYKTGSADWLNAEPINVNGTRNVLRTAFELDIPKIVYTSTVAVFGDTHGEMVDETYEPGEGPFLTEYDRTKWLAHYKVAEPLIAEGAPIVIVMPGGIYGPGDTSLLGEMMRRFVLGQMPAVPGPELTITWAHVDDIADGHILAAEKGRIGESYILAGPAIPMGEMVDFWSYLTGKPAPLLKVPARAIQPLGPVVGSLESKLPLPDLFSEEAIRMLSATYTARSDKARRELGWRPRPPQAGMLETFEWIATQNAAAIDDDSKGRSLAPYALGAALLLFLLWLLTRKRQEA
ncbi:MAG: NAD-dependent epimerase/dehydratase family protein [Anaerolineales bacterium]|nr:NAD-dependent epimerase/dehydratase family protein [Anaerolineales bacterium]